MEGTLRGVAPSTTDERRRKKRRLFRPPRRLGEEAEDLTKDFGREVVYCTRSASQLNPSPSPPRLPLVS